MLTNKQRLILSAIEMNPGIQDNEASLVAAVWRLEGWSDFNTLEENLKRVTHAETISRRRRELYNMGLITYSDKSLKEKTDAFIIERSLSSTL